MKTLVIFDSQFGNTEKIARAIGEGLAPEGEPAPVQHVGEVQPEDLRDLALLVVGCPTQRMNYTDGMKDFLARIPENGLAGVRIAAFDTRISNEDMQALVKSRVTRLVVKTFLHRFAAGPLAAELKKKGAESATDPEGFFVADNEGPLKDGELERARDWARQIALHAAR